MRDELDERKELGRQLQLVQRRVDEMVARLARARGGLVVEGCGGGGGGGDDDDVTAVAPATRRGDLFLLCVRLEVALAESVEAADKLAAGLRGLKMGQGDRGGNPLSASFTADAARRGRWWADESTR